MKKLIAFILAALMLASAIPTALAAEETGGQYSVVETQTDDSEKNGFVKEDGKKRYYVDGFIQKGFCKIDGSTYWFDQYGYMATGFRSLGGSRYYFGNNGIMRTGWRSISGSRYYFGKNGRMRKDWRSISGSRYYFGKSGKMRKGWRSINGSRYYFGKNGKMRKGWRSINGSRYYFGKTGKMRKGMRKINGAVYYFGKNGRMRRGIIKLKSGIYGFSKSGKRLSGFRKVGSARYLFKNGKAVKGFTTRKYKGKTVKNYFGKDGKLKTGTFKVGTVEYKARKSSGDIYSCRLDAPLITQEPELPYGCEITSWTMMANYAGVKMGKMKAAKVMPRHSSDPNKGFVGSPYVRNQQVNLILPDGFRSMNMKYLGSHVNLTQCGFEGMKRKLCEGKCVVAWFYGFGGDWSHTICVTGFDDTGIFYNDPWLYIKTHKTYSDFYSYWSRNNCYAVSY